MTEPRASGVNGELQRGTLRVSEEFLARYNRPGPRYTSYPTAPVWQDDFGPGDLERAYGDADAARTPVSLYMHLPFCESLCLFCACNVVIAKDHSVAPPYLATLKREIEHAGRFVSRARPVVQFHCRVSPPRSTSKPSVAWASTASALAFRTSTPPYSRLCTVSSRSR
jgi:oxygen-independent coproporphyrinogen-3 oxidase